MKPVNLNKVRKERAKSNERAQADENAVKHGLTKGQRVLNVTRNSKLGDHLSQMKFETE